MIMGTIRISVNLSIYIKEKTTFDNFCQIVSGKMKDYCVEDTRLNK